MMRIFIYHSNPERRKKLEGYINAYYKKVHRDKTIDAFSHIGTAFAWLDVNVKQVDILFVEGTNQANVLKLAGKLRESNHAASWVYVDGTVDGLCDSLILRPSAYINDSVDAKQIVATIHQLDGYVRRLQKQNNFSFKYEREYISIPFSNIAYFESNAKKVMLHLTDQSQIYNFAAKLDDIQEKMPETFLRCHQSYLVNMEEIRSLDTNERLIILKNNEDVLISRRLCAIAKEQYENYKSER